MPVLQFESQTRPLGPGVLTIGSGPEAGWRIPDRDLAPIHALVTVERDGHAQLTRPNALARILVNGEEVYESTRRLEIGDVLSLGSASFRLAQVAAHKAGTDKAYLRDMSRGRAWRVGERLILVGRDANCEVHLTDPDVSRVHAEIEPSAGRIVVRPKGGPVFHNGNHVLGDAGLREGDEVSVGRTTLRFTYETPATASVVVPDPERRAAAGNQRISRAQTSFMGVVQMREQLQRDRNRRIGRVARMIFMVAAVALAGFVIFRGNPRVALRTSADVPASQSR